ncbi:unnamed protein product [Adineta ricciae]|uniref:F-box domain-containing protein n=2 Tax=Adineta ricciae TaxID=249248 RepID=A0A815CPL8_ADIRI|nr:unnamed protein product [Adineta ricciae]
MLPKGTFEQFPDEILLLIFRYLSSMDILFSFYGLNSRLSQTINGYCQHIVLCQLPFKQYHHISTSILPSISSEVYSLTISNEWTGVLSKVFLTDFGQRMSSIFPNLQHLTLIAFISQSLGLILDCLEDFHHLLEINIHGLFAEFENAIQSESFLYRIFSANNHRLNSILFDNFSTAFHVNSTNAEMKFDNITKLRIELKTIVDLHRLLTILPNLEYLHTRIHDESFEIDKTNGNRLVSKLKFFHLQSVRHWWIFSELESILKRLSNVEHLAINIDGYSDVNLTDGEKLFSLLSKFPLKNFHYLLRLHDSSFLDQKNVLSTWQQFNQQFVCVQTDNDHSLILYSLPFHFEDLVLQCSLAKTKIFNENYSNQVKLLHLYSVPKDIDEIFSIISKCSRLHRLCLQFGQNHMKKSSQQQNQLCHLSHLTTITIMNGSSIDLNSFCKLVEQLPNLNTMNIEDELLQLLMMNQFIDESLKSKITHLCIIVHSSDIFQFITSSISLLASTFSSLKYLYFWFEKECQTSESLILSVFKHLSMWKSLIAFVTVGIILQPEILAKGIREWTVENSYLHDNDSFVVDYFEERFRLWL